METSIILTSLESFIEVSVIPLVIHISDRQIVGVYLGGASIRDNIIHSSINAS